MKKLISVLIGLMLAAKVFAGGAAVVSPGSAAASGNQAVFTFTFTPYSGDGWSNGKVSMQVPEMFNPEPLTITPYSGQVTAVIMRSGTISEPVLSSNISTNSRSVTITSLTFGANDFLIITYGLVDMPNSAYGINTPMTPGEYAFFMSEAPAGNLYTPLAESPVVEINNITLEKSANVSTVSAGMTFTYTLAFSNLSAVHQLDTITIWDTLPPGIVPIGSNLPFATQSLTFVSWNAGNLMYSGNSSVQLYCEVQAGIRTHGTSVINKAGIHAKDMYTNDFYKSAEAAVNVSGPVLVNTISAAPGNVLIDQKITVVMTINNTGNGPANSVMPDAYCGSAGTAAAVKLTGPVPAYMSILNPATAAVFTWVYQAQSAGQFYFTGSARGTEGGKPIETGLADCNQVAVLVPTPTSTATPVVPTATNTAVVIEPTSTPVVIDTPVIIPTSVEGGNVFTDKNYIKQGAGDKIRIYYEVPEGGKLEITVFNLSGERIRYFTRTYLAKQADYMEWDGKNDALKPAGKGIYFVHVKMGKWSKMKKVVILK